MFLKISTPILILYNTVNYIVAPVFAPYIFLM